MKKFIFIVTLLFTFSLSSYAQEKCPTDKICLSKEAASKAVENAKLIPILEEKIKIQANGLLEKDGLIKESQDTARINEANLIKQIHDLEIELARITGQLTQSESEKVRMTAIIDILLKSTKKKCLPFSICIGS